MFRFDGLAINAIGEALPACQIFVCTQPANTAGIPPSPLATLFADAAGTIPLANPVLVDGNGNFFFYTATGTYTLVYFDPYQRIPTLIFPDQEVLSPGGGSVSSVGMTVPVGFSVSGSPVLSAGVLALGYSSDWPANTLVIGPPSGSPAAPTRRLLTAADLAGIAGSVSSVNLSATPGALFTSLVTGGPITTSGVLNLAIDFVPQLPNLVLASPASGAGAGPISARRLVPKDFPLNLVLAFSTTPVFDGSANQMFGMTLTGNVASSTFVNGAAGQIYTFVIKQDGTGGRSFAWPANVLGAGTVDTTPSGTNIQSFIFDGTNLLAIGNMITLI